MGLFGKVFGKETCAICGNEVGALKKRKLADGVMCTDCTKKLSPWFDERKQSTVADIQAQLADREANRERLALFTTTQTFGEGGQLRIDGTARAFYAFVDTSVSLFDKSRGKSDAEQVAELNPDVISLDQVTDVDLNVVETRHEQKHTVDGEQVSYSPRHYTYMYQFTLEVSVDHPYIKRLSIPLNNQAISIANVGERRRSTLNQRAAKWIVDTATGWEGPALIEDRLAYHDEGLLAQIMRSDYEMPDYAYGFKVDQFANWEDIKHYRYLLAVADEAKEALTAPAVEQVDLETLTAEANDFTQRLMADPQGMDRGEALRFIERVERATSAYPQDPDPADLVANPDLLAAQNLRATANAYRGILGL